MNEEIIQEIVVTGMGLICPLNKIENENYIEPFQRLLKGESGIKAVDIEGYCKIAGVIDNLPTQGLLDAKEIRRNARFIHHGIIAAKRALIDANLFDYDEQKIDKTRIGVVIGSGIGGIEEMFNASVNLNSNQRLNPFFVPSCLINMAANMVSIKFGLKGPSKAIVTACASGAHSIMDAYYMLKSGQCDYVLAGGAEGCIYPLGMEGFAAMNALAKGFNEYPEKGSRPYDVDRSGFVMGEGAGVLVLERKSTALARGARIHASLAGFGASADANHITNPDSSGAALAIRSALNMARIESVGHINAHATSTPVGDTSELKAFKEVFGENLLNIPITSNKGAIGHLLGAAGAVEAIFTILSLQQGIIPPTLNLETLDPEAYINEKALLIKNQAQILGTASMEGKCLQQDQEVCSAYEQPDQTACSAYEQQDQKACSAQQYSQDQKQIDQQYALSTSFGFGGTNACLVFKTYKE